MLIVVDQVRFREENILLRIKYVYERKGMRIVADQIPVRQRYADCCGSGTRMKGMRILADQVRIRNECRFLWLRSALG